jgi:hypothetical protein
MIKHTHFTGAALALGIAAGTVVTAASAAPTSGSPGYRVQRQQQRLQQGDASGQLTNRGYARDQARLNAINAQRQADLQANGGHLSSAQKAQLQSELTRSSHDIYFGKHNEATQAGVKPPSKVALPNLPSAKTDGYVGDRVSRQQDRIRNGLSSGQLTRSEYGQDVARLHQIDLQREADLKANGGTLTSAEKTQLNAELNSNSTDIMDTRDNGNRQQGG